MTRTTATQRCIAGGGPAGMMLGLLRRNPARLMGIGARLERAQSPDAHR